MRRRIAAATVVIGALFAFVVAVAPAQNASHCRSGKCWRAIASTATKARTTSAVAGPAAGVNFHCMWEFYTDADRRAVLDEMAAAHIRWVRIDVSWAGIEWRHKGDWQTWYANRVDYCVNQAVARGLKVLLILYLTPPWANGGAGDHHPPNDARDYGDFAKRAAAYWKGRVSAWEVWNEPDPYQSFWLGTVNRYVELLKAGYAGFHAGDPSTQVVLGAPTYNNDAWIRQIYALGGKNFFDVLATHPYQGLADAPPDHPNDGNIWWFTHFPAVLNVMRQYGDGNKPVWFTEFGWSAHANRPGIANWQRGVTPDQQADYAVRAFQYARANYPNVKAMFWYKERAQPGGKDLHEEGYALLNPNLTPRPVYSALQRYLAP